MKQNDPKLGKIIDLIKPKHIKKRDDEFTSLVKIIIGQQLSGSAARTIIGRVEKTLKEKKFSPVKISKTLHQDLRVCGISNAKINYIKSLSQIVLNQPNFFIDLNHKKEKEILQELCKIKGIGVWTASIFAMGTLGHENIFPFGDVSLIKALKTLYGEEITIEHIIANWSPYISFGCRILWQWVDKGMPQFE